ncbi:MAG: hypothetical protein M0Z40_04670 [Actinomycetota bacterium]|nr:hypothetical protein [Actinomycetota bacterium]MDA8074516.1 hypothetical protein [Actinomycetota bacterium]
MPATAPEPSPSIPHGPLAHFLAHPDAWWKDLGHHLAHFANQVLPIAVPAVIAVLALVTTWAVVRVLGRLRPPSGGQLVEVAMPAVVEAKGALAFWRNLHPVLAAKRHLLRPAGHVVFEMEGSGDGIGLRLWVSADISAHAVARAVSSAWPGAQCQVRDARRPKLAGPLVVCGELRLSAPAWLPLGTDHVIDPLRTVIGALGSWDCGQQGLVQVLVRPAAARSTRMLVRAARSLQTGRPTALVPRLLAAWRSAPAHPSTPDPMRTGDVRHAVHKASDLPAFEVAVRYGLSCAQSGRGARRHLRSRAHELTAAFGVYAGRNHLVAQHRSGARRRLERRVFGRAHVLGLSEVAGLAHLPYDEMIPGLAHASAAAVAPPPGVLAGPWRQDSSGREDDDAYF